MKKVLIVLLVIISSASKAQQIQGFAATSIATGITKVTCIENCGDDRLFLVQQNGIIKIFKNGSLLPTPFLNIGTLTSGSGEQGLLGLAFSPDYQNDRMFYVYYTNLSGNTVVARYFTSPGNADSAMASSAQVILTQNQPFSNHNGGCLKFDPAGYLMIGLGDGGSGGDPYGNGQNTHTRLGKILRIDVSDTTVVFAIPPTNPFINDTNYLPEIWNYGMRNPWRFSFDRTTGDLWIADVGQNAYEEINLEPYGSGGGFNYGWKCYEGLHVYNTTGNCASFTPDMIPVFEYTHSGKCSVSGGFIYRGAKWNRLFGRYVYADYCENKIRCLTKNNNGLWVDSILLNMPSAGFSCFGEDQFGELYAGNNTTGIVYSITDTASCTPVAAFAFTDSITVCNQNSYTFTTPYQPGFLYQWYLDGSPISNSDTNSIISTQTGTYYVQVVGVNFCTNTSDSVYIEFNPVPAATINALDSIYCDNDVADTLTASPAGGYFTIDGDTAFVFDPVSAGLGQHTVQYFYTDTNGCSTVVTQQVLVDACLGINELKNNSIQIIPNPNNGVFKLMLAAEFKTRINVMVTDVNGLKVFEKKNIRIENNAVTIDLRKLPESTYIISVTGNNTCISKRLIIKK